jgi:nucleotide-binding universal stress UspA family protein
VVATARTFAELLQLPMRVLHVGTAEGIPPDLRAELGPGDLVVVAGDPAVEVVAAIGDPDVALVVIGSRNEPAGPLPAGHVTSAVLAGAGKPILLVPPTVAGSRPVRRVLVPLEGTAETSVTVTDPLIELSRAGVEPIALHVFDEETVPRFWDDLAHARSTYAHEFRRRWCDAAGIADVRLRRGHPATHVLDLAEQEHIDLIALGWNQDLGTGRAELVRAVLEVAEVPVLLVPIEAFPGRAGRC